MNAPAPLAALASAAVGDAATAPAGLPLAHESAELHVSGRAQYTDDLPLVEGTLWAAPGLSTQAHARVVDLDLQPVLASDGVVAVLTARDIPGVNDCGPIVHDDPILADGLVQCIGQPLFLVLARSHRAARAAAARARVRYEPLPALLSIAAARAAQSYVLPPVTLAHGDAEGAIARAPRRLAGRLVIGGQEQFYLEGQVAYALPREDGQGMKVYSSTQHPSEMQHLVARMLGVPAHRVDVECRRMGGGFGGKESQSSFFACLAALGASKTGRPVRMRADRDDDMLMTGKRHDFEVDYEAGFDEQGRLHGVRCVLASRCGYSADLSGPVNDRALFHLDNAYRLPALHALSLRCKTHTQSNTAFRGFGGPQGMLAIEVLIDDVARALGLDPLDVRLANYYDDCGAGGAPAHNRTPYGMAVEDFVLHALSARLVERCGYRARRAAIRRANAASARIKRGIAFAPVKFGISFTATHYNQAGALLHVYTDGSVLLSHGGTEMGQGLYTKVRQVAAAELGLPVEQVHCAATDTARVPNTSATAASSGSDLNGKAAQHAAQQIRARLLDFAATRHGCEAGVLRLAGGSLWRCEPGAAPVRLEGFAELVQAAYRARVQLWASGFYATPKLHYDPRSMHGRPFFYFAYGASVSEVAIDVDTGESRVLRVDIEHDVGASLNPAVDRGQIEGGFVQGMGWLTTEELWWNAAGKLMTHAPSTYKIPCAGDVPEHFDVQLFPNQNAEDTIYRSKAVGEPPLMLANSVFLALRDAVSSVDGYRAPVPLDAPATAESILRAVRALQGRPFTEPRACA